jgi:hypothetical protein
MAADMWSNGGFRPELEAPTKGKGDTANVFPWITVEVCIHHPEA